jgi:hypothetical protein
MFQTTRCMRIVRIEESMREGKGDDGKKIIKFK